MQAFIFLALLMLQLASLASPALAEEEYWTYTFRPGDSIWKIARDHTTSVNNWRQIQDVNNIGIGPDRSIQPGTRIKIPLAMLKRQPVPAIAIAVSGDVELLRANGDTAIVQVGDKLYSGDRVITLDNQNLRIRFADNSELQVLQNSEIKLDKLSYHKKTGMVDTRIRLQQGRVNTWVEKLKPKSRYQIQTPAAITAVRGTRYRVNSDASQISRAEVTEGLVGVSAGGESRELQTGFGLVVEKGKPLPEPVKLLDAPQISDNLTSIHGQLRLSWTELDGAAEYRYQLALDEDFDELLLNASTDQPRLEADDLPAGAYYFRVRGIDSNQLQGLNALRSYVITRAPPDQGNAEKVIIPSGMLLFGQ